MVFNINSFIKTKSFKNINNKLTQEDFYRNNNSCENILKLVRLNNKAFGETLQCIVKDLLDLDKSCDAGHDAQKLSHGLKFEIKSARYWISIRDFKWQHIMEEHEYDYLILVGIDFDCLRLYLISKYQFMKLKTKGIAKQQGRAEGQGLWVSRKKILDHLIEIKNKKHFYSLIHNKNNEESDDEDIEMY